MRFIIIVTLIVCIANMSGCAAWTTYNKRLDLEDGSVAIDAKQRVIISHPNQSSLRVKSVICAEPSPDALAVLGASGALTASKPSGTGGSASGGVAESAASIGLRTQSIQLLRDLNYRICEAYSNDAIGWQDVAGLLRRGQSTMMGLIAIEQLTGPVVANQVALSASVNAGTGGPSGDVTAAQTMVATAKENLLKAQAELDTASTQHQTNIEAVNDKSKKLSEAVKAKNSDQSVIDTLTHSLETAQDTAKSSRNVLNDKRRRLESAQDELVVANRKLLEAERGKTGAAATTSGQLGELARWNAQGTKALAEEVRKIVGDINESYLLETCFSFVSDDSARKKSDASSTETNKYDSRADATDAALKFCTSVLEKKAENYSK